MTKRHPAVNNNFMNERRIANAEPDSKDFCPSCSIRLKYTSRLNDFFCSQCGYVRREGKPISFIIDSPPQPLDDSHNSRRKGPLTSSSSSTSSAADYDRNLFMRPISTTRSQQSQEDSRRRRIQGYDNDLRSLERRGYNIIDSHEILPADNSTFDANEARGSFSNLSSNKRMYFH